MTVNETLSLVFSLYKSNLVMFLVPMLVAGVVSGILAFVLGYSAANLAALARGGLTDFFWRSLVNLLPVILLSSIVSWIVRTLANGVCIKYASDILSKGNAEIGEAFDFTIRKLVSLLGVAIVTGILIVLGFIALIVPGIILAMMFYLVVPVIMVEDVGALDSLSRSRKLVSKRWGKTFVIYLVVSIVVIVVSSVAGLVSAPFGLLSGLVNSIVTAVVTPISPISEIVYYYSMLAREQSPAATPPSL